jgi:lipoprotein-anchoring transpeptidase ErfK/SrfK
VDLPEGEQEVRPDAALTVTTTGAVLDRLTLERLDQPGPAPDFRQDESEARLAEPLEAGARYRLTAQAHALATGLRLPWQAPARIELALERVFNTAPAPALVAPEGPWTLERERPLDLRFSQPLATARVEAARPGVEARVAPDDPRVLRVTFQDVKPAEEIAFRVVDVQGQNGARAEDQQLLARAPEPVILEQVNGVAATNTVTLLPDQPVTLLWNTPIASLRYRVDDTLASWSAAPSDRIELPLTLAQGETRLLTIEDATDVHGGWLPERLGFDLAGVRPLRLAGIWPSNGATGISPEGDPTFRFSEPVADRAAAEAAIRFDPAVPGRFEWTSAERVRFIPESPFPRDSEITVRVEAGPQAVVARNGSYLAEPSVTAFRTGKLKVIDVNLSSQRLVLLEDGVAVWSAPVATGVRGAETPPGSYRVQYKMPVARFRGVNPNGSRYDIPDVKWVLAFFEDYTIHGAYWRQAFGRPASNGCISLTDANAKVVFDWADEGTRIDIRL